VNIINVSLIDYFVVNLVVKSQTFYMPLIIIVRMEKVVLKPTLMIASIIGFVICSIYTFSGKFTEWFDSWGGKGFGLSMGFAFCFLFVIMFISTILTMTPGRKKLY
jgi:hypothetical protein